METNDLVAIGAGFLIFFVLGTTGVVLTGVGAPDPALEQPIAFNHKRHVEDVGLECTECHQHYETETFSGLPGAEICALCHEEAQGDSPEELRLVERIQGGEPLEWHSLYRQPPHVFYSHRRHVMVAGLECATCHQEIAGAALATRPPRRVVKLQMEDCLGCHLEQGAATDCTACHR